MSKQKQPSKKWTLKDTNKTGIPYIYTWSVDCKSTNEYRAKRREELRKEHPEWSTAEINHQIYQKEASIKSWICLGRYDSIHDFDALTERIIEERELFKELEPMERREELERIWNELEANKEEIKREAERMKIHAGHYQEALKELMDVDGLTLKEARKVLTERRKTTGSYI